MSDFPGVDDVEWAEAMLARCRDWSQRARSLQVSTRIGLYLCSGVLDEMFFGIVGVPVPPPPAKPVFDDGLHVEFFGLLESAFDQDEEAEFDEWFDDDPPSVVV